MTDLQTKFLRAIAAHVGAERVVEVHLFPSIRQGPQETGVAVVAAMPEGFIAPVRVDESGGEAEPAVEIEPVVEAEPVAEADAVAEVYAVAEVDAVAEAESELEPDVEAADETADEAADEAADAAPTAEPAVRHVVYSARYRAVLKGPERGKWEVDVVAEADAPLITVEAVVRGMRQRSSDAGDPERIDGDALRALLEAAWSQPA